MKTPRKEALQLTIASLEVARENLLLVVNEEGAPVSPMTAKASAVLLLEVIEFLKQLRDRE